MEFKTKTGAFVLASLGLFGFSLGAQSFSTTRREKPASKGILLAGFVFFGLFLSSSAFGATNVYYSVGQNTSNHETGAGTVTVSGTTATFSVAQTAANMGVGDVVDYDSDNKKCYISGKTSFAVWSCVSATGGTPTAATNANVNSIAHAFNSLSNAESGIPALLGTSNLVTGDYILNIPCYQDSAEDTSSVTIDGWTTGSGNYIRIYAPNDTASEVNVSQRHAGKWNNNKFRLMPIIGDGFYISDDHVRIEGIQIAVWGTAAGVWINAVASGSEFYFSSNIIDGVGGTTVGIGSADADANFYVWNNLVFDCDRANSGNIDMQNSATAYVFNNTVTNGDIGLRGNANTVAKNNLSYNNGATGNYYGSFHADSTSNLSGPGTDSDIPPDNSQDGVTVTFINAAGENFRLAWDDAGAKNFGADLSTDPDLALSTDIEGEARPSTDPEWDIGADEHRIKNVYYSVGQTADDLKTGSPTFSIASGVATFSVAQTGNIGVGDRVTYDSSVRVYISGKISTSQWRVVTATGQVPPNTSGQTVNSITREYTSLTAAEAGANDASHLNTQNLVSENYVLNFPCYYDTGADTAAFWIDDWSTGPSHYIRIYTPNDPSTEANQSQRHDGKWSNEKYRLEVTNYHGMVIRDNYVRVEGLQVKELSPAISTTNIYVIGLVSGGSSVQISESILLQAGSAQNEQGLYVAGNDANVYVWNSVIGNPIPKTSGTYGINIFIYSSGHASVYNSVLHGNRYGTSVESGTLVLKNTYSGNTGTADFDGGTLTNCASEDATGSPGLTGIAYSATAGAFFQNVTSGSENFHLKSSSLLKDAGTDTSGDAAPLDFTTDIDGDDRPAPVGGEWDIGVDEYGMKSRINPSAGSVTVNSSLTGLMTNGLVGMWSFDGPDISGVTALDRSGQGNNGTISGAVPAAGQRGQALSFNGTSDYVSCGNVGSGIRTVAFWIKADDLTFRKIMDFDGTDQIEIDGSGNILATSFPGTTIVYVDGAVSSALASGWHQVVVTDTTGVTGSALDLGRVSTNYFDGILDEVRLYDRVLSPDEVGDLYRLGQVTITQ